MTRAHGAIGFAIAVLTACTSAEPLPADAQPPESRTPSVRAPSQPADAPPPDDPAPAADTRLLHPPLTTAELLGITGDDAGHVIAVGSGGTIVRSDDRGRTWALVPSGTANILRAAWRDASGAVLVVGDDGIVLRSIDDGEHWGARTSGTHAALHHLAGNANELFAAGEAGTILRSRDHGDSWEPLAMPTLAGHDDPPAPPPKLPFDVAIPPREPTERESIRALFRADAQVLGIGSTRPDELFVLLHRLLWHTRDGGDTWQVVTRLKPPHDAFAHLWVGDVGGERFYVTGRNAHGPGPDFFVGLGRGGETARVDRWHELDSRLISPPVVAAVAQAPGAPPRVILGGDGYAVHWSTDDGATWTGSEQSAQMQSPYALPKRAMWIAPGGDVFAAGRAGALMHSADEGRTWTLLDGGAREPLFGGGLSADGRSIYAALDGAVLRGRGGSWELLGPRDPGTAPSRGLVGCCTDLWIAPDGTIIAAGDGVLWRSTDDGLHWSKPYEDDRGACCWSLWGDAHAVHGIDRDVVISSHDGGKRWTSVSLRKLLTHEDGNRFDLAGRGDDLYAIGGKGVVLHSRDGGKTWAREDSGTTEYLYAGFVGETADGAPVAYAVGEHGTLLRSTDRGPWSRMPLDVATPLQAIHGDASTGELFIAGTEGVLRSRDAGATWSPASPGFRSLRSVFGDGRGRVLALGGDGVVLRIAP